MDNKSLISSESAIKTKDDDDFNFFPYAKKVQDVIQGYSNIPEPLTIGIYGKWGSGKTTFLNFIERHIELFQKGKEDRVYIKFHYNPWMYSESKEMLFDFYETLSKKVTYQGDENLKKAGKLIKKYSRYLKSVKLSIGGAKFGLGASFEPYEILQKLGEDLEGEPKSLIEIKNEIDIALQESNKKIIIFIDDIDRLDKDEIFSLFKLVKANADFKNLIFIMCMDYDHITEAIYSRYGDNEEAGKNFIEKIVNIPIELPLIEKADLDLFIKNKILPLLERTKIKEEDKDELLSSLDGAYFNSPREIIRVINSFSISLYTIGNEVNIHDLFWIEYLKIKYNKTYTSIKKHSNKYRGIKLFENRITLKDSFITKDENESKFRLDLKKTDTNVSRIIDFLFPVNKKGQLSSFQSNLIKEDILDIKLKISHINHFEKYFSFHTNNKISEIVYAKMKNQIFENKDSEALETLNQIINKNTQHKVYYRIKNEIENIETENIKNFALFVIDNLNIVASVEGFDQNDRYLLGTLAKRLKSKEIDEHKGIGDAVASKLSYLQLTFFLEEYGKFNNVSNLDELEKLIIEKIKANYSESPFYINRRLSVLVMHKWNEIDSKEFNNYIVKTFNSKENLSSFIRCFVSCWSSTEKSEIWSSLLPEDYNKIKEKLGLDINFIAEKIKEYFPENIDKEGLIQKSSFWGKTHFEEVSYSIEDNIEQFYYYYLGLDKEKK